MTTMAAVHAALDQLTASAFAAYPVFYSNQSIPPQTAAHVRQLVVFTSSNQMELGNPAGGRNRGLIIFQFHTKRNTGNSVSNAMHQIVLDSFKGKLAGGAVLQNARASANGETENWAIRQVEVPFYFDS